jgi:hypothetical protein
MRRLGPPSSAALLLGLQLVACGRDATGPDTPSLADIAGRWRANKIEYTNKADPSERADLAQLGARLVATFAASGDVTLVLTVLGQQEVVHGTASVVNNQLVIRDALSGAVESLNPTLDGSTLTLRADASFDFDLDGQEEPATLLIVMTRSAPDATPIAMMPVSPITQTVVVGQAVGAMPSVRVTDEGANPVAGVVVTFVALSPGATLTGTTQTTNADGIATLGGWIAHTMPFLNLVIAQAEAMPGSAGVTFEAEGVAGAPTQLAIVSGDDQIGTAGATLPLPIEVRALDTFGNLVRGATVTFAVVDGGGSVTPAAATTDATGVARATWTVGSTPGANTLSARIQGTDGVTFRATVTPALRVLSHAVVDAEYSQAADIIVSVSANPSQLNIINPGTGEVQSVALPTAPTCVSVRTDGLFAAVGHDAFVTYVNLQTRTVVQTYSVSANVVDVVLANNGYVYAFPGPGGFGEIHAIDVGTGTVTSSPPRTIYGGTLAKMHPSGDYIYGATNGLSPSDVEKYDIRQGDAPGLLYDSPYHGDYPISGDLWISEDGSRLFARSRYVFRLSADRAQDMIYAGSLSGVYAVRWATDSPEAARVFVVPVPDPIGPTTPKAQLRLYDIAFLEFKGSIRLPQFQVGGGSTPYEGSGEFVFVNASGTKAHVLLKPGPTFPGSSNWGLTTYDVNRLP